jgi:serine/threonine-protein kinase
MPAKVTLRITEGEPELVGNEFPYEDRTTCIIGRSDDCNPQVPDDAAHKVISHYHCHLDINPPDIRVRDFGSLNGTYVNGEKIGQREKHQSAEEGRALTFPEYDLKDGDEIRLCKTVFRVSIKVPAMCVKCSREIPDEQVKETGVPGIFVCPACFDEAQKSKKPVPVAPPKKVCSRCGKDVSREIGPNRQGDYVCAACRSSDAEDFMRALLRKALEEKKRAGNLKPPTGKGRVLPVGGALRAIADYELVELLGRGGMGEVWLAKHRSTDELVALKTMLPQVAANEQAREIFLREVEVTKALDHTNVVKLFDSGYADGTFFFTLEYCDGGSVDKFTAKQGGKLHVQTACEIVLQALEGLDYAHRVEVQVKLADGSMEKASGVVHRDLKPANIFLSGNGTSRLAKVADFGLGKAFDTAGLSGQTRTGARAGSPWFMPRQQVFDFKYSKPEVDVWAMAACLYNMLCGPHVFPRDFAPGKDVWSIVLNTDPVPIRRRNSNIPQKLAELIDEALVDKPSIHYKSAAEFKRAIEKVL